MQLVALREQCLKTYQPSKAAKLLGDKNINENSLVAIWYIQTLNETVGFEYRVSLWNEERSKVLAYACSRTATVRLVLQSQILKSTRKIRIDQSL